MGVLVAVVSLVLMFSVPLDSAEFVVSVCSLVIGLTLIGLIALFAPALSAAPSDSG